VFAHGYSAEHPLKLPPRAGVKCVHMRVPARRLGLAAALAAALALAGCGSSTPSSAPKPDRKVAGSTAHATAGGVVLTRDPEEQDSFPLPAGTRGAKKAPLPGDAPDAPKRRVRTSTASEISPGAPSDAEVRRELKQMEQALKSLKRRAGSAFTANVRAGLTPGGNAQTPLGAPDVVARVISGGNAIARFPYIWGGGHGSFVDSGYDCSGSVSYALAAAGLLDTPLVSGQFAKWGAPGPGKWVTIYANAGHVFMYVAGLRFDTSGRDGPFGSRWQTAPRSLAGFEVRHPPGL
jgi:cell wall-associated NlpC family hydrolase